MLLHLLLAPAYSNVWTINGNHWRSFQKSLRQGSQIGLHHRELLAVYESVQHFRHLSAQHCTVYFDHKPLIYAFHQRREKLSPVQLNHLSFISEFTTDIQHVSGAENIVADAMSRVEAISQPVDFQALAASQDTDDELWSFLSGETSLRLEKVPIPGHPVLVYCDTSTARPRPHITAPFRRRIFDMLHNLSHPGARATTRLVTESFVWPSVLKDCHA